MKKEFNENAGNFEPFLGAIEDDESNQVSIETMTDDKCTKDLDHFQINKSVKFFLSNCHMTLFVNLTPG